MMTLIILLFSWCGGLGRLKSESSRRDMCEMLLPLSYPTIRGRIAQPSSEYRYDTSRVRTVSTWMYLDTINSMRGRGCLPGRNYLGPFTRSLPQFRRYDLATPLEFWGNVCCCQESRSKYLGCWARTRCSTRRTPFLARGGAPQRC